MEKIISNGLVDINTLEKMRESINISNNTWMNLETTNCYAYALGLDIPYYKIIDFAYDPGVISNSSIFLPSYKTFTYEVLLNNIFSDLDALGIDVREINPLEKVNNDEWKIALFTAGDNENLTDFHFLRQRKNGLWLHKNGFQGSVTPYDSNRNVIINPEYCVFSTRKYEKTLALKLK